MKKTLAVFIAAVMLAAFIPACGNNNAALTVWCAQDDKEMITMMVNEFSAANPSVKSVKVEVCEDDATRAKFEGNPQAAADVICIPHDQLGALVEGGALCEITEKYIGAIGENTALSIKAGQVGGRQYGFPSSFETQLLFYDKSILSNTEAVTLEGILSSGALFAMDFGNAYFSANWFFTYGCKLFGDDGNDKTFCDFDSPDGVAAMSYLIDNREKFGNCAADTAAGLFKEHKLGAYIGGPWNAAAMTEALKGNYGCAMLPAVDGKPMKSFAGFKLYCVNANTKNKAAAMELASWLTNPANQKTRFLTRNLIPVAVSLADDIDVAVSATAKAVMAQGAYAIAMPSIPEIGNFWEPTGKLTLSCYQGDLGISELQDELTRLASAIKGLSPAL